METKRIYVSPEFEVINIEMCLLTDLSVNTGSDPDSGVDSGDELAPPINFTLDEENYVPDTGE